jgi:hypothetical protein
MTAPEEPFKWPPMPIWNGKRSTPRRRKINIFSKQFDKMRLFPIEPEQKDRKSEEATPTEGKTDTA